MPDVFIVIIFTREISKLQKDSKGNFHPVLYFWKKQKKGVSKN